VVLLPVPVLVVPVLVVPVLVVSPLPVLVVPLPVLVVPLPLPLPVPPEPPVVKAFGFPELLEQPAAEATTAARRGAEQAAPRNAKDAVIRMNSLLATDSLPTKRVGSTFC
jgi:hypothetical protein